MKKIRLLFVGFGLLMAFVTTGQTLTYRFVNPRIIKVGGLDKLEFSVEMMSSATTYFYSGQIRINFSNTALSAISADWTLTRNPDFTVLDSNGTSKYTMNKGVVGGILSIPITPDVFILGNIPSTSDYIQLTANVYRPVCTLSAKILSSTEVANMQFDEASMNAQQSFITVAGGPETLYSDPVPYDPANFTNTYLGRLYSTFYGWSQVGNTVDAQWVNWTAAVNTSVWDGTAILPAGSLSNVSDLRIHNPAILTVPPTGQLSVANIDNNTNRGIVIQSNATGTGSVITGSATSSNGVGNTSLNRYMTGGTWHLICSPLLGQSISNFLATNPENIPTQTDLVSRGMIGYSTLTDAWSPYFTSATSGNLVEGIGYAVRTILNESVAFKGVMNTGDCSIPVSTVGNAWNIIGNPYTSAINLTDGPTSFYNQNIAKIDPSYGLYIWDEAVSTTQYTVVNLSDATGTYGSVGQSFFVKPVVGVTGMDFKPIMQVHNNAVALKSAVNNPQIKLIAQNNAKIISTSIKFIAGTSKGLDAGYDAGFLQLDPNIGLYTRLVEDNGINFAIQCLPQNDYNNWIIPVGIKSKVGGNVIFSAEFLNLPVDCKVILEDKVLKKFTDLSTNVYAVALEPNSVVDDRFQIHTSYQTTGLNVSQDTASKLSAYAIRNVEIKLKGQVSQQAIATLYDIQGKVVVVKTLEEGNLNSIPTPNIRTGIYMLFVKDNGRTQSIKIPVNE